MNTSIAKQQGFSLLEILIAFSILSLSLAILLKIFSGGVNTAAVAEDYTVAVQLAEALMARAGVETPLQVGETQGVENDKYQWRVSINPYVFNPDGDDISQRKTELFKVDVVIAWDEDSGNGRQFELSSLKLRTKTQLP